MLLYRAEFSSIEESLRRIAEKSKRAYHFFFRKLCRLQDN
jgi:hypothetical protein